MAELHSPRSRAWLPCGDGERAGLSSITFEVEDMLGIIVALAERIGGNEKAP